MREKAGVDNFLQIISSAISAVMWLLIQAHARYLSGITLNCCDGKSHFLICFSRVFRIEHWFDDPTLSKQ
jgi:hypothetical protein